MTGDAVNHAGAADMLDLPPEPLSDATGDAPTLPPYPAYKPSGVDWLGNVPAHWEVRRLKHVADLRPSNVDKKSVEEQVAVRLCNYTDVYYRDRITNDPDFMKATATADQVKRFTLRRGDVLITKDSEDANDIAVPAVVAEDLPGVLCGYHLTHIRPRPDRAFGDYLYRAFASHGIRDQFRVGATGVTRYGLSGHVIADAMFPLPPLAEQREIAGFLDRATGRVDALVARKRRLLELLAEQRQALITHAVTRGLDPHTPTRPTNINWLGNVPEHWEVKRLKHLLSEPLSYGANESAEGDDPDHPRYIRITDIADDGRLRDETYRTLEPDAAADYLLQCGDLLLARSGATVGKTYLYRDDIGSAAYAGYLIRARFRDSDVTASFVRAFTESRSYWEWVRSIFIQSTIQNISAEKYAVLPIPLPPPAEQRAIVAHLDAATGWLDALSAKVSAALGRLAEYRAALITAAVTGQLDVRAAGDDDAGDADAAVPHHAPRQPAVDSGCG